MAVKRKKHEIKGAASWLVTMGDMNNLLMCFFIVLMGDIAVVTQEDFFLTLSSFRGSLGMLQGGRTFSKGRLSEMGHTVMALPSTERKTAFQKMAKMLKEAFKPEMEALKVRVSEDERGLVITMPSDVFFDTGSADLRPEARQILGKVAKIMTTLDNYIRIEGHTDNVSVSGEGFKKGYKTNWDLSSARSISVLRYLAEDEAVEPGQLSAVAFGQYRPIDDNSTPEGRAYNRRVDIVILKERILEKGAEGIRDTLPDEEWR